MNSGEVFLTPSSFYFPSRAHRNVVSFLFTFPAYVVVVWKLDVASWLPGGAFAMRLAVGAAVILGGLVRTGFSSWEAVTSLGQRLRTGIQVVFHIADNYVIFLAALLLLRFDLVVPPLLTEQDAKVVLAVAYLLLEIATYILYRNVRHAFALHSAFCTWCRLQRCTPDPIQLAGCTR
ncbi:MAG: uncharacterized protein KVP18_004604 [Porospora cf. gigantea A]|uniref:uncharacterized protein n=1 Tax=Porospora cf. gigantea A TaxID=2853593 RepID=UPI00355A9679|nr:MAG: hypothetical protein KVP18_004604 [Porospora cf. gigantea A]